MLNQIMPEAIFQITCPTPQSGTQSWGTAFFISPSGYALTCAR